MVHNNFVPLFSIHAIAFKNHMSMKQYFPLKRRDRFYIFMHFIFMSALGVLFQFHMMTYFILYIQLFGSFSFISHYYFKTQKHYLKFEYKRIKTLPDSSYVHNLVQIVKEEQLKVDFLIIYTMKYYKTY